jgi:hypothetical protein
MSMRRVVVGWWEHWMRARYERRQVNEWVENCWRAKRIEMARAGVLRFPPH